MQTIAKMSLEEGKQEMELVHVWFASQQPVPLMDPMTYMVSILKLTQRICCLALKTSKIME